MNAPLEADVPVSEGDEFAATFARALSQAQQDMGWSPGEAAEALGVNRATYSNWLHANRKPRDYIRLIPICAAVFRKTAEFFLGMPEQEGMTTEEQMVLALYRTLRLSARRLVLDLMRSLQRATVPERPAREP